jgi:hypothetical protein
MGVAPLFCCFKDMKPLVVTIIGLVATVISFAFYIWILADILYKNQSVKGLYITVFVFLILIMICFIVLLIFLLVKNVAFGLIGKIICLVILGLCALSFIFLIIAWAINLDLYRDLNKLDDGLYLFGGRDWACIILPEIIAFIVFVLDALCANYLYKFFSNLPSVPEAVPSPNPVQVPQTTVTVTPPNYPQPALFPPNNNPPVYPVEVRTSEQNFK